MEEPAFRSTRLSLPRTKNANERLSGDQKGKVAPNVPSSGCASRESMGRTQISRSPSFPTAVKAMSLPSGDSAGGPATSPVSRKGVLGGGLIEVRMLAAGFAG